MRWRKPKSDYKQQFDRTPKNRERSRISSMLRKLRMDKRKWDYVMKYGVVDHITKEDGTTTLHMKSGTKIAFIPKEVPGRFDVRITGGTREDRIETAAIVDIMMEMEGIKPFEGNVEKYPFNAVFGSMGNN